MFKHLSIEPNTDLFLRLRRDKVCRGEPIGINERRRIRVVPNIKLDFLWTFRVKAGPVSPAAPHLSAGLLR